MGFIKKGSSNVVPKMGIIIGVHKRGFLKSCSQMRFLNGFSKWGSLKRVLKIGFLKWGF